MNRIRVYLIAAIVLAGASECGRSQDGDSLSAGARFHFETSFGEDGYKGTSPTFGREVPLYKSYPGAEKVALPAPMPGTLTVVDALEQRRSVRRFAEGGMSLEQLSRMVLSADGLTGAGGGFTHRAAPSAGALYPMELYVIVSRVEGLAPGLYHFHEPDSTLELIAEGELGEDIHAAANNQNSVGNSPITLVLTARFDRVTKKYADRGYRYAYMEAGAIMQNVYLQAASLNLGTVMVGSFNDDLTNALLEIDGLSEAALWVMPVGIPAQ